jgi:hypothetical protein
MSNLTVSMFASTDPMLFQVVPAAELSPLSLHNTTKHTRKRPRRTVHFETESSPKDYYYAEPNDAQHRIVHILPKDMNDNHPMQNRPIKRHVAHVESVLNLAPKEDLWVQPLEVIATLQSIRQECALLQQMDREGSFASYVDALQASYEYCCGDGSVPDDETSSSIRGRDAEWAVAAHDTATNHTAASHPKQSSSSSSSIHMMTQQLGLGRGMESYCVPPLAVARCTRRRYLIQCLVQLYCLLEPHPTGNNDNDNDTVTQRDAIMRHVATTYTAGSQRFALALGAADAMAALTIRCEDNQTTVPQQQQQQSHVPIVRKRCRSDEGSSEPSSRTVSEAECI